MCFLFSDCPELFASAGLILLYQILKLGSGRQSLSNGNIVVEGVDNGGNVFAHICLQIPRPIQKLFRTIVQVGCNDIVNVTFFIELVKFLQSVGKQTKGAADDDLGSLALL